MESRQKHCPRLGDAISVAVAKQDDSILAWYRSSGLRLEKPEEKALDAFPVVRPLGCVRFRYEHVTIRKNVNPPRMVQTSREGVHSQAVGCQRRCIACPASCLDDVHNGDQWFFGRGEHRTETGSCGNWKPCRAAARRHNETHGDPQT